ncbi:MAG TPA: hypothetical protein VMY34_05385, partial [Acidimicrobiales bacterium]|nr:hypothetical protein [Acidimicrobiales bacterium]
MHPGPYTPQFLPAPRPLFRDSRQLVRATALVWVLAALATLVVGIVQSGREADRLERYRAGELPASRLDDSFNYGFVPGGSTLLTAALSIGGLVLVIVATFRLSKNHQALGRPGTRFGPGWAIAGWL